MPGAGATVARQHTARDTRPPPPAPPRPTARARPPVAMASGYLRYLFNREPQKMLLSSVALVGTMGYFLKVGAHRVSDRAHAIATESALRAADERMAAAEKGVEEHYASARRAEEMVKLGTR